MDNQNTDRQHLVLVCRGVLILVLMDNQNTGMLSPAESSKLVLILVLMDNQNTLDSGAAMPTRRSLNPCSNG